MYNILRKMFMFLFLFFSMLSLCSFFRLKELFQVKNGVTTSLLFLFLKMPKILVGRTTLNGEKKGGWPYVYHKGGGRGLGGLKVFGRERGDGKKF